MSPVTGQGARRAGEGLRLGLWSAMRTARLISGFPLTLPSPRTVIPDGVERGAGRGKSKEDPCCESENGEFGQ